MQISSVEQFFPIPEGWRAVYGRCTSWELRLETFSLLGLAIVTEANQEDPAWMRRRPLALVVREGEERDYLELPEQLLPKELVQVLPEGAGLGFIAPDQYASFDRHEGFLAFLAPGQEIDDDLRDHARGRILEEELRLGIEPPTVGEPEEGPWASGRLKGLTVEFVDHSGHELLIFTEGGGRLKITGRTQAGNKTPLDLEWRQLPASEEGSSD